MFEVKTDCFAYKEKAYPSGAVKRTCMALNGLFCKTEECKFYKPIESVCRDCKYEDCKGCPVERK